MPTVRLLGPVDVIDDDGVVYTPGSPLRCTLLALLALQRCTAVDTEALLERIWDGRPPASGLRALRFHISRLRSEVGIADLIVTVGSAYRLDANTDVVRLADGLTGDADADSLAALLATRRGDPFLGASACSALEHERRRLDELTLSISERLYEHSLAEGDTSVIGDLTRLCLLHPVRESLWALLIRAQYQAGNQADALRTAAKLRINLRDELGVDPSREVQQLELQILDHDVPQLHQWIDDSVPTGGVAPGNLPRLQDESVGDFAALQRRVSNLAQMSVVTLTGSGGVGKTRAAIEVGWLVVDEFDGGVWFVELATVADADLVITTIAGALGAGLQPGATVVESIVEWCVGRRMLLILDNCEHVLDSVSEVVGAIVAECPTVTIVATSREPIGVAGETVVRIASLEERYATELFIVRARSADSEFEPTDAEAIAAICRRLDGIPLAIELAAARIRSLSPAELLERLDDRFRLLRGGGRGALERHRTLRATVAWSYQLLSGDAQLLFDRLSVFVGSFDLDAIEAVCAGGHLDDGALDVDVVMDVLGDLVDKSMVIASRSGRRTRYRLLETLRQFGEERLDDRDETVAVRDAHVRHFVTVAQHLGQRWDSPQQADAGDRFDDDWENLGTAHAWAITTGDIDKAHAIFGATGGFAIERMRRDHQEWGSRTLELADISESQDVTTYWSLGHWAFFDGDPDRAVALGELAAVVETPEPSTLPGVLTFLGHLAAGRTDATKEVVIQLRSALPDVLDPIERFWTALSIHLDSSPATIARDADAALAAARAVGAPYFVANVLRNTATRWLFTDVPDFDRAIADVDEAIRLHESIGTTPIWEWLQLTWIRTLANDPAALDTLQRAVLLAYGHRHWAGLDGTLEAAPALLAGQAPVVAATIYGYLEKLSPPYGHMGARLRATATHAVDAIPENGTHRARGAALDRHDLVALALAVLTER